MKPSKESTLVLSSEESLNYQSIMILSKNSNEVLISLVLCDGFIKVATILDVIMYHKEITSNIDDNYIFIKDSKIILKVDTDDLEVYYNI